jgi:Holliday junction resolvase RusA-like endonuclease
MAIKLTLAQAKAAGIRVPRKRKAPPRVLNGERVDGVSLKNLPLPPSLGHNGYWGRTKTGGTYLTKAAKEFRQAVQTAAVGKGHVEGRISVTVYVCCPANGDIDNFGGKQVLDAIQHAGIIENDCQVDALRIIRVPERGYGYYVTVNVEDMT